MVSLAASHVSHGETIVVRFAGGVDTILVAITKGHRGWSLTQRHT